MSDKKKIRKLKRKELQAEVQANAQETFNSLTPEQQDSVVTFELQRMIVDMRSRLSKLQEVTGTKVSFKYCFPISDEDTRTVFIELSKEHSTLIKQEQTNKEETNV